MRNCMSLCPCLCFSCPEGKMEWKERDWDTRTRERTNVTSFSGINLS